ncbi:peptidase domain-containing ABC transporter [Ancylomarina euxinus]|uniref:Peptidase domain-containing ABC transporter n=1 Tax=Ancylomarina euxinus TaxID=2283627 RepID=A0A425Y161_9BACT|nr:peptidase domain-containing ABC transporter [Ancylomarina euxinus]MCZ4693795.1 peptidase domain-containing ABC transporter [Ancylomarina euxinus]MUP15125.1 ATP-binding cassette domain-containing protein [Ancylomarina euxinus]RRG21548.1 peptidase domain-containing ABC transporter [Ancylomarina euxinus]
MRKFPIQLQLDGTDCGPSCLKIIAKYYGKDILFSHIRDITFKSKSGVSILGISEAADKIGFRSRAVKLNFEKLKEINTPTIVHWNRNHFVVVYKIKKDKVYISDPAIGLISYSVADFLHCWASTRIEEELIGFAITLNPTPEFYNGDLGDKKEKIGFSFLVSYIKPYRSFILQLILGFLIGSILSLILPFLTQAIVDIGISNDNINFVVLVLVAQLILSVSQTTVGFIRSWIMLHVSTRISISIISDFLIKLMKLPIRFFDTKMIGDIRQRIDDNNRIQTFLTDSLISMSFGIFIFIIYSIVLAIYDLKILLVFYCGSALYVLWIVIFLKKRAEIDYKRFSVAAMNQSNVYQLITGMQEIKLNGCEKQKRWEWEDIQAELFSVNIKGLSLNQAQQAGSIFINQIKNILISFLAAREVINGNLTLGMMMSVQYIIGQLNSPIEQFIGFMQSAQDARISLERLGEIYEKQEEENVLDKKITEIPADRDIYFRNADFRYGGPKSPLVLNNISLKIPQNKITAIVGASGSGKTTLIKLLLGFYEVSNGVIKIGSHEFSQYNIESWRNNCGTVMQEGYIFSDTIAKNIAVSGDDIDEDRLERAVGEANIKDFIEGLPMKYDTKIGQEGSGLSQGQKQRILIARAIYKNPHFIFFDEATNALDSNNEKVIMTNLNNFFKGKTVVVVAHRLSTVKNADQIVVLDKGLVVEVGTHEDLIINRKKYYDLIVNQLELEN